MFKHVCRGDPQIMCTTMKLMQKLVLSGDAWLSRSALQSENMSHSSLLLSWHVQAPDHKDMIGEAHQPAVCTCRDLRSVR